MATLDRRRHGAGTFTGILGLGVPWPVTRLHPITRTAPFPTRRLRRSPFTCFLRYYEAATTAYLVSPSSLCRVGRRYLGLRPGRCRLSQVPSEPHCAFALLSDSGRASVPSLHGTPVLPPLNRTMRASTTMELSELYHTASALAVYASCHHYWRRRKTRFRGWPAFPGWDSNVPTVFVREVSALRLPLPLGLLGATACQLSQAECHLKWTTFGPGPFFAFHYPSAHYKVNASLPRTASPLV